MRKFVVKPRLDLFEGVLIEKDTKLDYKNDRVEQRISDLTLSSIITEKGTNGVNEYESKSYLTIHLNENDILLFNEEKGYFLPNIPMSTIDDAITDITVLKDFDE